MVCQKIPSKTINHPSEIESVFESKEKEDQCAGRNQIKNDFLLDTIYFIRVSFIKVSYYNFYYRILIQIRIQSPVFLHTMNAKVFHYVAYTVIAARLNSYSVRNACIDS